MRRFFIPTNYSKDLIGFLSSDVPELEYLGCWIDNPIKQRILPDFYSSRRGKGLDWYNLGETVLKCGLDAVNSGKDYNLFAVQFYGECYSAEGNPDYKKMRAAPNSCVNGMSAYQFLFDLLTD